MDGRLSLDYFIEIRDTSGNFVQRLSKDDGLLLDFQWNYTRIGGCGTFSMRTKHGFSNLPPYSGGYDVRLKILNPLTGDYVLWYRGIIEQVKADLKNIELSTITGRGYSVTLIRLFKTGTFTNTEISVIVKDLLDNNVLPNTDITYDSGDIEATDLDAADTDFIFNNRSLLECFETLADTAGGYEWGVGSDLKFFFKSRTDTPQIFASAGRNIIEFDWLVDYARIVNSIKLEGGETGGSKFTRTVPDTGSQTKFGLRERIIQNSSITTNATADRYGNSILAEQANPRQRGNMRLFRNLYDFDDSAPLEATIPIGTVEFRKSNVRFGQKKFGTFRFGGQLRLQINTVKYKITDNGIDMRMGLGGYPPDLALTIKQLDLEISQVRQRST